jgi:hypothetical protein
VFGELATRAGKALSLFPIGVIIRCGNWLTLLELHPFSAEHRQRSESQVAQSLHSRFFSFGYAY